MKSFSVALVGLAFLAAGGPAFASPAFDAFRKVCGDANGDFAAVKTAVGGGGWSPIEVAPNTMEGITVTESLARQATLDGAKLTLFAWHGTKGKVEVSACTLKVVQAPFAGLVDDAKAFVGFAPETATGAKAVWRYTETGLTKSAVQKADYDKAAAAGGLDFLTVSQSGAETVIDLLKIKS